MDGKEYQQEEMIRLQLKDAADLQVMQQYPGNETFANYRRRNYKNQTNHQPYQGRKVVMPMNSTKMSVQSVTISDNIYYTLFYP